MVRSLRSFASLALLFVLSSAPLATVVCAEWCAPSHSAAKAPRHHQTHASGHELATAMPSGVGECHRTVAGGPAVTAHLVPECLDSALSTSDAGPIAPRLQVAPPMNCAVDIVTEALGPMLRHVGRSIDVVQVRLSRPLAASPVLRI